MLLDIYLNRNLYKTIDTGPDTTSYNVKIIKDFLRQEIDAGNIAPDLLNSHHQLSVSVEVKPHI